MYYVYQQVTKGPGPTQEGYYKNVDLLTTSWFFPDVFLLCVCIVYSKVIMCCYMSVKLVKACVVVKGLFLRRKMVQCLFFFRSHGIYDTTLHEVTIKSLLRIVVVKRTLR